MDHAPPTKEAAERRGVAGDMLGAMVETDRRGSALGADMGFRGMSGGISVAIRVDTHRRNRTVGQKSGMRAGKHRAKGVFCAFPAPWTVDGSIAVWAPSAALCGCGTARNAKSVHMGKTSIKSMRFNRPLGWKKDTSVEGTPKPMWKDQCDSAKRNRFSSDHPRSDHTCSKQKKPSTKLMTRNDRTWPTHGRFWSRRHGME